MTTANEQFPLGPRFDPGVTTPDEYVDALYQIFLEDLVSRPLCWKCDGLTLSLRRNPEIDGRHAIFWHIVSGGSGAEASRQLEPQRCIRLRWIRILIEIFNAEFPNEGDIRWWIDTKRTSKPRYVITRPDFDYVVVVEQRSGYALLVTAYYAEQAHRRRKLQREHDDYWAKQEPPTQ